jgi:hypothetical protein
VLERLVTRQSLEQALLLLIGHLDCNNLSAKKNHDVNPLAQKLCLASQQTNSKPWSQSTIFSINTRMETKSTFTSLHSTRRTRDVTSTSTTMR